MKRSVSRSKPTVYVIGGPNGAGKTTFASEFLPDFVQCREFLNADLMAAGLSPFSPEAQNLRAGRLLLERIRELSSAKKDFGFETTFSGRTYLSLLAKMKSAGYQICLFFLWLPTATMASARVENRVRQGGHGVAEADVHRRYSAGLRNWLRLYRPLADAWWLYDASLFPPKPIAHEQGGKRILLEQELFHQIELSAEI
jgi:predicted ABC-type ATPase